MIIYREYLIPSSYLTAKVSGPTSQDKGDKDTLSIFSTNNVEAKACWTFLQYYLSWISEKRKAENL